MENLLDCEIIFSFLPFSIFNQYWRISFIIGCNSLTSNMAELLQKNGPNFPNLFGQIPWIIHVSFCEGNMQTWSFPLFIHVIQSVIGHRWVNIKISKSFWTGALRCTSLLISELKMQKINEKFFFIKLMKIQIFWLKNMYTLNYWIVNNSWTNKHESW